MQNLRTLGCIFVLWLSIGSSAVAGCTSTGQFSVEFNQYLVSGVLKKKGELAVIKLVHSAEFAVNSQAALEAFIAQTQADYPEYEMVSTLVSNNGHAKCIAGYV